MGKWLKRTFDYGKKGKVVVIFDDGKPRMVKKVIFVDPDETERVFDRAGGSVTVTPKGKDGKTSKSPPSVQKTVHGAKIDVYVFDKDDWEISVTDEGEIEWKKKAGKPGEAKEKVQLKGKTGQGDWTHDDGTTDKPDKSTDEDVDEPKNP